MGSMFGGSTKTPTPSYPTGFFNSGGTTYGTTTTSPYAPAQPIYMGALQSAQNLYNQGLPGMYSGQYLPNLSPQTTGMVQGSTNLFNSNIPQSLLAQGAQGVQGLATDTAPGHGGQRECRRSRRRRGRPAAPASTGSRRSR